MAALTEKVTGLGTRLVKRGVAKLYFLLPQKATWGEETPETA